MTLQLLNALYSQDLDFSRKILVGTRGELDAELEEQAYRWRSGRMADLGFTDYYEALEVYREIDPASVRLGGTPAPRVRPLVDEGEAPSLRIPSALVEKLASGSPFARAIAGVTSPEELANLNAALVALSNRVLAADRVTPGDDEAVGGRARADGGDARSGDRVPEPRAARGRAAGGADGAAGRGCSSWASA